MKKIIKILFPESIKTYFRKLENFFLRLHYGFSNPVILSDIFSIKFILYPEQQTPIRWLIERGAYKKEYSAFNTLIRSNYTVFDVGSHIGIVACYLCKIVGENGSVHSFEPFPDSYNRLNENIVINDYKNIKTNQVAISDKIGNQIFYYEPSNWELNSLGSVSNGSNRLNKKINVEVNTIDNYCEKNKISKINFLKIDTEGYEINVLRGSEKMLKNKSIDLIQFEISKIPLESLDRRPDEIILFLKDKGYFVYEYLESENKFHKINDIVTDYDNYYASYKNIELSHD